MLGGRYMRLIRELIEKKITLYNEFMGLRFYRRAIWNFYCAYNLSLAFLNQKMDIVDIKKRHIKWVEFLEEKDNHSLNQIQKFIEEDMQIVYLALNNMVKINENEGGELGDLYISGTIGMSAFEFYQS